MAISPPDFAYISELARRRAAIVLEPGKEYLVESRLSGVAKGEGHAELGDLITKLKSAPESGPLHAKVIDALTTNETFFFRDHHPFEVLKNTILPKLVRDRAASRRLSIWCAACSTGQEPYSVAMLLREHFPVLTSWNVKIAATDLSPRVLAQAREGLYSQMEVNRGLPAQYLIKYFRQDGSGWRLNEDVRKLVDFQELNLIQPWVNQPVFDLVFLRNVMIYFDIPTKRTILKNIRKHLARDGYLFLGAAETVINMDAGFVPVPFGKATAYAIEPQLSASGAF